MNNIRYIDEESITHKRVLMRVDFNVSQNPDHSIANDERIRQTIPSILHLLKQNNTIILLSHLGRPKKRDPDCSLAPVAERLEELLKTQGHPVRVRLIPDLPEAQELIDSEPASSSLYMTENIRFFPGEKHNDESFTRSLAALGDVFVNDAFGVCHRTDASVTGLPEHLPSYAGMLLKKEITTLDTVLQQPRHPVVAILGGAKISTKIALIGKLTEIADTIILGGGLANTLLAAQGIAVGKSIAEYDELSHARRLIHEAKHKKTTLLLPRDVVVSKPEEYHNEHVTTVEHVAEDEAIYDIGPETEALYGAAIAAAHTIIWNGPVGFVEEPNFRRGTDYIYYSITHNTQAVSIVGGGDTISAIAHNEYLEKITHISTGGGAMLEYIEKGSLPGIDALKRP